MRTRSAIVDTGYLVSLLDRCEKHHTWAKRQLEIHGLPWVTCEAVIAEAWFILRRLPVAQDQLLEWLDGKLLLIPFNLSQEIAAIRSLRGKFRDVPMSLADACLVRWSELLPHSSVLTLDSDFHVYRRNGSEPIPLVRPED